MRRMMQAMSVYHDGNRRFQERFDTRRLADRLEARDMFFLATADELGAPQCSYKGGDPGFVACVGGA